MKIEVSGHGEIRDLTYLYAEDRTTVLDMTPGEPEGYFDLVYSSGESVRVRVPLEVYDKVLRHNSEG